MASTGTDTTNRHRSRGANQAQQRLMANGLSGDESSDEATSGSSDNESAGNSDDSDWQPAVTNGHRERRAARPPPVQRQESSRSSRRAHDQPSSSRGSRREKKEEKRKKRSGKKSESPQSRYELRDLSKPSSSRAYDLATRGASSTATCNGASSSSTRRNIDEPVIPDKQPSDRAKRYKQRLTTKRQSPTLMAENEGSSSVPDSEIFESRSRSTALQNGPSSSKSNGVHVAKGDDERFQAIPQWMTQTSSTVRFPFVPQIGDEVVYIWRGHRLYVDAVQAQHAYAIKKGELTHMPYNTYVDELQEEEICRVDSLSVELRQDTGVRLIAVKLAIVRTIDTDNPIVLSFKFHDLANVLDFVILRQWYDRSLERQWSIGDKFRSQIDGQWYCGVIVGRQPPAPRCNFRVYRIMWDSEDDEDAVSPWDIEPLPKMSRATGEGASSSNDVAAYNVVEADWPPCGDHETACQRILSCIDQVMGLASAELFVVPVDYTAYPAYLCAVAYPVDLSLIRQRLVSGYYRRLEAIKWDVRHIGDNAEGFNEADSAIVRQAHSIVDILIAVIEDPDCIDASTKFPQRHSTRKRARVTYNEEYASSDELSTDEAETSGRRAGCSYRQAKRPHRTSNAHASSSSSVPNWKTLCQEILSRLWKSPASAPFHTPVDMREYPDYCRIVRNPVDLGTIKRRLQKGEYSHPSAFIRDARLLLDNSRRYNTNEDSPIYAMTTTLGEVLQAALSDFGELLNGHDVDDDNGSDSNQGDYAGASSSRRAPISRGRSGRRSQDDDDAKRYRTRLRTGTIHYSNVQEIDDQLDQVVARAANAQRRLYHQQQEQEQNSRYQYRRLRTSNGGSASTIGSASSLRRPSTRHLS